MNFIRRRSNLLTRGELMGFISAAALDGVHSQAWGEAFPGVGVENDPQFRGRTHVACEQASRALRVPAEEEAVAKGILAEQVALDQAVQLVEQKVQRKLTEAEKVRILDNLSRIFDSTSPFSPPSSGSELLRVRGPRISRDVWGH